MKKLNLLRNLVVFILVTSMSLVLFAGCQSKNNNTTANNNQNSQNRRQFDPAQMKQRMEDSIKSLVTDGTITQDQSDKIVAALTTGNGQGFGQRNGQQNGQGSGQNKNAQNGQNSQGNGQGGNRQNGQPNPALQKLVTDKVITQAQADAVMQKIRGGFGRPQNNQTNQNNQNNSTSGS